MKRVLASTVAILGILAGSLSIAAPAQAATYSSYVWSPTGITKFRLCPSLAAHCDGGWYSTNGGRVQMLCYHDGEYAVGAYGSNRWFKVLTPSTSRQFWVHSSLVYNQTRVGRC